MDVPPLRLINLDRCAERLRSFGEWNAHLGEIERVSATDGAALHRSELVRSGYITGDFRGGPGTLGCAMSHIRLWETAARDNRPLTILEDDVIVSHHFDRAAWRVMSDLPPDWDLVKWGWTPNLGGWVDIGGARVRLQGDGQPQSQDDADFRSFQAGASAAAPVRMLHSLGLFAYSISAAGARAALRFCLPLGGGLDEIVAAAYPRMHAYLCMPSLVLHSYRDESVRMQLDRAGGALRSDG
jgi:hypothetical protein